MSAQVLSCEVDGACCGPVAYLSLDLLRQLGIGKHRVSRLQSALSYQQALACYAAALVLTPRRLGSGRAAAELRAEQRAGTWLERSN